MICADCLTRLLQHWLPSPGRPLLASLFFLVVATSFGQEALISNFCYGISGNSNGSLSVFCRSDKGSGITEVQLAPENSPRANAYSSTQFPTNITGIHSRIFAELTGEYRRVVSEPQEISDGNNPLWMFSYEEDALEAVPFRGLLHYDPASGDFTETRFSVFPEEHPTRAPADLTFHSDTLWLAFGSLGLGYIEGLNKDASQDTLRFMHLQSQASGLSAGLNCPLSLDPCSGLDTLGTDTALAVYAVHYDSTNSTLWLGTTRGLKYGTPAEIRSGTLNDAPGMPDSLRISGIFGSGQQFYVESSRRTRKNNLDVTESALYYTEDGGTSFSPVIFRNNDGKTVAGFYDSLNVSLTSVAPAGDTVWAAFNKIEGELNGLLRIRKDTILPIEGESGEFFEDAVFSYRQGLQELNVAITAITSFPFQGSTWLAASSAGGGISVSADHGQSWIILMNRTEVSGNLKEIRIIPSIMLTGYPSRIAYKLNQDADVTIEVFSYDMHRVRTIVKSARRRQDAVRSSDPREDVWDGKDENGARVAPGTYYIRVRDDKGHEGWGKAMYLEGRQ